MRIVRDAPLEVAYRVFQLQPPIPCLTLVVKGTFDPQPDGPSTYAEEAELPSGEAHWDDDPEQSLRAPSDLAILKPAGEALLVGSAWAPRGEPVDELACRFAVGPIDKAFSVHGDREFAGSRGRITAPVPFARMPLRLERSYGGPDDARNPYGRGKASVDGPDGPRRWLPNLEDPTHPIASRRDRPPPVILGPVPAHWPSRASLMGTYDGRWQRERWPWLPEDFDFDFFLEAPADQQLRDGFFEGDEAVVLQNLHPDHPVLLTRLPGVRPRAFLRVRRGDSTSFDEVGLRLDTVTWDSDLGKLLLVWRGLVEVPDMELRAVEHVFVSHEPLAGRPRPAADLEAVCLSRLQEEDAAEAELEGEEPPAWERGPAAGQAALDGAIEDLETRLHHDALPSAGTQALPSSGPLPTDRTAVFSSGPAAAGTQIFRPDDDELVTGVMAPRELEAVPTAIVDMRGADEAAGAVDEAQEQEAEIQLALLAAQRDELAEASGLSPVEPDPAALAAAPAPAGDDPADEALAAAMAALKAVVDEGTPASPDAPADDDGLGDVEWTARALVLERIERGETLAELDLSNGDLSGIDLGGQDLTRAVLTDASLVGTSLASADLTDATLDGADLTRADFTGARLTGASLVGVVAAGVSFAGARLDDAELERADLRGASFAGVTAPRATFTRADLEGARFTQADLVEADFDRARLDGGSFHGARMPGASLEGARADGACFDDADATNVRCEGLHATRSQWRRIRADDSTWEGAFLEEADFAFSEISRADFTGAHLVSAGLDGCRLRETRFDGADLQHARLRKADLFEASLDSARLVHADLRGASLFGAELYRASLEHAQLELADLGRTKLVR